MNKFIEVKTDREINILLNIDKIVYIKGDNVYFSNSWNDFIILNHNSIIKLKKECLK